MADNFVVLDGNSAQLLKASKEQTSGVHADKAVLIASDAGGVTSANTVNTSGHTTTAQKTSGGQLYGFQLTNRSTTAPVWFKVYNKSTAPTVGTDTPVKVIGVPMAVASGQVSVVIVSQPIGISLLSGIGWAVTGGIANNDTTALSSGDVTISIDYK